MIKESLENYRLVGENEEIEQIVSNLQRDNPFYIDIDVEKKEYEVKDTTELRNKIGYLFNIFFSELIKYRLRQIFNNKAFGITDEKIKNIDGLSL